MKKTFFIFSYVLAVSLLFSACSDDNDNSIVNKDITGCYIINYGNYSNGGASVTRYDYNTDKTTNNYFESQNKNIKLTSNIQHATVFNDNIYMMGNESDEIIIVDKLFQPVVNSVSTDIAKPRYCVGYENYLYISCLGASPDWSEMPDTYIAKFNTLTNSVETTIAVPGGPEGLAIANGKLYAALNYTNKVAVIDLNDLTVSYIETPAVTSYFLKDNSGNLYASLVSTYSDASTVTGLGYINTTDNTYTTTYQLDGISSGYSSIISANADFSTIYVVASAWVEESADNWVQQGAIFTFDVASQTFSSFAENLTGTNGVVSNPENNDVYVLTSTSTTEAGIIKVYNEDGTFVKDITTGISPYWALFLK